MSRLLDFMSSRSIVLVWSLTLIITSMSVGCDKSAEGASTNSEPATVDEWLPLQLDGKAIQIQIAYKQHELSKGLMYRASMGEHQGMLFFYGPPKQMSFFMRNTKIPLDIGYFTSDGVLREIYPMYPMDERSVRSRRSDILIALEMNQGWYAKNGVKPGATFDLPSLKAALLRRGIPESKILF